MQNACEWAPHVELHIPRPTWWFHEPTLYWWIKPPSWSALPQCAYSAWWSRLMPAMLPGRVFHGLQERERTTSPAHPSDMSIREMEARKAALPSRHEVASVGNLVTTMDLKCFSLYTFSSDGPLGSQRYLVELTAEPVDHHPAPSVVAQRTNPGKLGRSSWQQDLSWLADRTEDQDPSSKLNGAPFLLGLPSKARLTQPAQAFPTM